jgi:hypothetical protein
MYSINMLHYISISSFLREIMASYLSFNSLMQELSPFQQFTTMEKIFKKWTNQIQELPVVAMFVNGSGWN